MADGFEVDSSELSKLVADLSQAPGNSRGRLRQAVTVTSLKVKKTWQQKLSGSRTLGGLPAAVTYDVLSSNSPVAPIEGEIGFDKSRAQGPLGNVSEYGTPKVAPRGYGLASLQENEADFEKGIEIAIDQSLKELGL